MSDQAISEAERTIVAEWWANLPLDHMVRENGRRIDSDFILDLLRSLREHSEEHASEPQALTALFGEQKCGECGERATCFGSYDESPYGYACDDCCGHGGAGFENGRCVRVVGTGCQFGQYCQAHYCVHGSEAEQLRWRLEKLLDEGAHEVNEHDLRQLLDAVDAGDSLAVLETTGLKYEASLALLAKKHADARALQARYQKLVATAIEVPAGGDGCFFCKFGNCPGDPDHYVHRDCLLVEQGFIDEYGKPLAPAESA